MRTTPMLGANHRFVVRLVLFLLRFENHVGTGVDMTDTSSSTGIIKRHPCRTTLMSPLIIVLCLLQVDHVVLVSCLSVWTVVLLQGSWICIPSLILLWSFRRYALLLWPVGICTLLLSTMGHLLGAWVWVELLTVAVLVLLVQLHHRSVPLMLYVLYGAIVFSLAVVGYTCDLSFLMLLLVIFKGYLVVVIGIVILLYGLLTPDQVALLVLVNAVLLLSLWQISATLHLHTPVIAVIHASISSVLTCALLVGTSDVRWLALCSSVWSYGVWLLGMSLECSPALSMWFAAYTVSVMLLLSWSSSTSAISSYSLVSLDQPLVHRALGPLSRGAQLAWFMVLLAMPASWLGIYKLGAASATLMVSAVLWIPLMIGYMLVVMWMLRFLMHTPLIDQHVLQRRVGLRWWFTALLSALTLLCFW